MQKTVVDKLFQIYANKLVTTGIRRAARNCTARYWRRLKKKRPPFYPRSAYAVAKLYSHWATINNRESYRKFACNGVLFNHESPRRAETFVTRKITRSAARIKAGLLGNLYMGNLSA